MSDRAGDVVFQIRIHCQDVHATFSGAMLLANGTG